MPLFMTDDEFQGISHDVELVAKKADAFIQELYNQLETVKAEADAASITAEQTCSIIEQKYVSLSAEFSSLQSLYSELEVSLSKRDSEFGQLLSEKQRLLILSIEKDGEIERLTLEGSELHKSKRQLMEILEQKDLELSEKNTNIKSYLDKIVNVTEIGASKEARQRDLESEMLQLRATSNRLLQEKELLERHNAWLNEELTAKTNSLIDLRKANGELEVDMSSKLVDAESKYKDCYGSLEVHKDRVRELEAKLSTMEEELLSAKKAAISAEQCFSAEISTVTKLVDLYKESSDEWSKKSGELEGVIKALETHLRQAEVEYKENLEKLESSMKQVEKESSDLKEKLCTAEMELENLRKEDELKHLPLSSFTTNSWLNNVHTTERIEGELAIVPRIPAGVSGTALAASLLRDGWSLAKMYAKYQEAVDALQHEQLGRKHAQDILERVLFEIEEKAAIILDERVEHERLVESYATLERKLQHSLSEYSTMESDINEHKANLKRKERECLAAQKEIVDLQKQVAVLLKECRDVQLRCGSVSKDNEMILSPVRLDADIPSRLLTFKDINELVTNNSQLRSLVRHLSDQISDKEAELKEMYEIKTQKVTEEAVSKVNTVLLRAKEQEQMIESLHTSVALYKKLYEEEQKIRSSNHLPTESVTEYEVLKVHQSQESRSETSNKSQELAFERLKSLEEESTKSRNELISLRAERDKLELEAQFAQEKLARFMKEFDHQREEHKGVVSRNVEFSQLIVDYQKKLRENYDSLNASDELSRKLTMEVSILKHEKEILQNSEKRAFDEVRDLSERVHRLQATLDTLQTAEDVREEARGLEKSKKEEYIKKLEQEWAEAKKELQDERNNVRSLALERESTLKDAFRQVEELSKELTVALQSVAAAESRAAVAETRCSNLEKILQSSRLKDSEVEDGASSSVKILRNYQEEIEKLKFEALDSKEHMLQYKSIAQVNEEALKQMESAYEKFKIEADDMRKSLEDEVSSLKECMRKLESECKQKTEEAATAYTGKEDALAGALFEISSLKEECSIKMSQIVTMESQISALREDVAIEHKRWRTAQENYERQVILQSETIQELTKTSQLLASTQEEASELRKATDSLKTENDELKSRWEVEKVTLEVYKNEADKKYKEVDELNKILHSRLEALKIKSAEKERLASGSSSQTGDDDVLQNVVNYLRRSKDIAETEMSLLKQEKLRLQSQLESALKSAQAAQASLQSGRQSSQALLFTEEEFKSLQLQVRELTLLRESNVQLREENKKNFEECQKLRDAFQNVSNKNESLEKLLRDRETDLETCNREIDNQKMERLLVEQKLNKLVEKYMDVDIDDYKEMKESFHSIQMNLREKDEQIEEINKLLSEKQDAVSHLEGDLALVRTELIEKETRISENLLSEASLKSDLERVRRINIQSRRKFDSLSKEKEELSKELLALTKQLDDAKQSKKSLGELASEQALREKDKEKDTRIQILERTLERHREDLKKEKEDHHKEKEKSQKIRKTIIESREIVNQQKTKLTDELNKHKNELKSLQDEVEKLKSMEGSQFESSSELQNISSSRLEDLSSSYFNAVENFEQVAQPVCNELESSTTADVQSSLDNTSTADNVFSQAVSVSATPVTSFSAVPVAVDEKDRRSILVKGSTKTLRKLVRPGITKPKDPQGDMESLDVEELNSVPLASNAENQGNLASKTVVIVRKRPSASFSSDLQEEILAPEEENSDVVTPVPKKSKSSDGGEENNASSSKLLETLVEESSDDMVNLNKEEPVDVEREEFGNLGEQIEESTADYQIQAELPGDAGDVTDEKGMKQIEAAAQSHVQLRDQIEQDLQQIVAESGSEREDGELIPEFVDNDGDSLMSNEMGEQGVGEQAEQFVEPENIPGVESVAPISAEVGEIDASVPEEKKISVEDITENILESSNKIEDVDSVIETDQASDPVNTTGDEASTSTFADVGAQEQGVSTLSQESGGKPASPVNSSSTTINLLERARQRAHLRQADMQIQSNRARGRATRGRGIRGGRMPRGGRSPG